MNLLSMPFHSIVDKIKSKSNSAATFKIQQWKMQDIVELIGKGLCAYTGQEFDCLSDATFERVNPKVGYVPGNVIMVRQSANTHKSQLDAFMKNTIIGDAMKIKLLRKALYQLEKTNGKNINTSSNG